MYQLVFLRWLDKEIRVDDFIFFVFDSDGVKGKWTKQEFVCVNGFV
jgi:hypothetical protein